MGEKISDANRSVELALRVWETTQAKSDGFYEVWFNYLGAALECTHADVQAALKKSRKSQYANWDDVRNKSFESWIVGMAEELSVSCVRALKPGRRAENDELTIAIKLTRNEDDIVEEVAARVRLELHQRRIAGKYHPQKNLRKPKLDALQDALIVYNAVQKTNEMGLTDNARNSAIRKFYKDHLPADRRSSPLLKHEGKSFNDYVSRCVRSAEKMIKRVAAGSFP